MESVNLFDQLTSKNSDQKETTPPDRTSEYGEKIDGDTAANYIAASMRSTYHDHIVKGVYFL